MPAHIVLPIIPEHPRLFAHNRDMGVRSILAEFYQNLIYIINNFTFKEDEKLDKISLLNYCQTMYDFLNPHNEPLKYPQSNRIKQRDNIPIKHYKKGKLRLRRRTPS